MSSLINKQSQGINIFEKLYLQQTNKFLRSSTGSRSLNTSISSNLSSSFHTTNNEINLETSYIFKKCFQNSVIPYLSISDLIQLKMCSKLLNSIIDQKAINICIISNSIKKFSSNDYRMRIWSHYMDLNKFISILLLKYFNKNENVYFFRIFIYKNANSFINSCFIFCPSLFIRYVR